MAPTVVVWCGPVSASNLAKAAWRSATHVITIPFSGSDTGGTIGADFRTTGGNAIRGLLAAYKLPVDTTGIVVAGFSAGHGLIEQLLKDDVNAQIAACGAFDAYYTNASKTPKTGYLAFAVKAIAGNRSMLLTCSHNAGPTYPSCADATAALVKGLGLTPGKLREVPPTVLESVESRGDLVRAVYGDRGGLKTTHVQHATILAPAFLPDLVEYARIRAVQSPMPPTPGLMGAVFALGVVAGGLLVLDEVME